MHLISATPLIPSLLIGLLLTIQPAVEAHAQCCGTIQEMEGADEPDSTDSPKSDWNVMSPPGETQEIPIDVTRGTWMNLSVHPKGTHVLFDLLGDLYTVPIAGGQATPITEGMAWDMQPTYSPDGMHVAFTSDRGGGDNIWVSEADGSNPRAITQESFRLLTAPSWDPSGRFIVGRKHFTSRRSIGAGEMWLYHIGGGEGVQMTVKPNEQKDIGEPVFSPDGKELYFSQDVSPGTRFEYNKDPNPGIYAIQRMNRADGHMDTVLGGPGGAIRPTPSPDGRTLAYIQRDRGESVLRIRDLRSGDDRALFRPLDRDLQETWAIHGVYPAMDWMPDGRTLVFWAGGRIRTVNAQTGVLGEIPFHVKHSRTVTPALRSPVPVSPETFDVKVLRWAAVSPQGDKVVYQALGRLHVKDLPTGTPRRLTRQEDHMEMHPVWSPDGRSIAYTTWDDDTLGTIRVIRSRGGKTGQVITKDPGHYTDLLWSPERDTLLFHRRRGGWLTSPRWSENTGVFTLNISNGAETRIARKGQAIGFSPDGSRIRLIQRGKENIRELQSVNASGEDMRTLATSKNATAIRISPDDQWLAFVERFHVHVMPWPRKGTGKPFEIGPGSRSLPVVQLTEDAGTSLHFSGAGEQLHWVLGPDLFSTSMTDTFAFTRKVDASAPEPVTQSTPIGFRQKTDSPEGSFALVGARILPMKDETVLENGTVWIVGNRIQAIGDSDSVTLPPGTRIVDASGTTIVPGFVDVHDHGAQSEAGIIPEQSWSHLARLAFGVTTIHDPSNDTHSIFAAAELARAGKIVSPRIYSTGTILYGAKSSVRAIVETLDDARSHLRRMKAIGARSVKSYNQPRRDQRQKVLTAARELDMMVVPEGGSLFQHNMTMVVDGHTGVEHSIPVAPIYEDVQQLWGATEVGYTPTLTVAYGGMWGEEYWYHESEVWKHPRLQTFVPRFALDPRARRSRRVPQNEWNHFRAAGVATAIANAGGRVNIGAHGQREGLASHWEMWMLAQGGMTPWQVLRSATLNGAWYVGLDQDIGTLEVGKLADLVVLEKNPLDDIRNTDSVRWTVLNGRMYDAATMDQIHPKPQPRKPLFFELEADPDVP